eukprot:2006921-Pyramimonas_sp.AAC.1
MDYQLPSALLPRYIPTATLRTFREVHAHAYSSMPESQDDAAMFGSRARSTSNKQNMDCQRSSDSLPSYISTATLHAQSDDLTHSHSLLPEPQDEAAMFGSRARLTLNRQSMDSAKEVPVHRSSALLP